MGIVGCSTNSPTDTVKAYLDGIKKGDQEKTTALLSQSIEQEKLEDIEQVDIEDYEFYDKYVEAMKTMTYTINSEEINGEEATINVTVDAPNLGIILKDFMQKIFGDMLVASLSGIEYTEEELMEKYDEVLTESLENVKNTERTGNISLKIEEGEWKLQENDSLIKLLTNIDESIFDMEETSQEEVKK